jgi:hypothetical protein
LVRFFFYLLVLVVFCNCCGNPKQFKPQSFSGCVDEYVHLNGRVDDIFEADSLKHAGQYQLAANAYKQLLKQAGTDSTQIAYLYNELVRLHNLMGQWDMAAYWQSKLHSHFGNAPRFKNDFASVDYWYNQGETAMHNDQVLVARKCYEQALRYCQMTYSKDKPSHYKLFQVHVALGEWCAEFKIDSCYLHLKNAERVLAQWDTPILNLYKHYAIRYLKLMAPIQYFDRDIAHSLATSDTLIKLSERYLGMNREFIASCYFEQVSYMPQSAKLASVLEKIEKGKSFLGANSSSHEIQKYWNACASYWTMMASKKMKGDTTITLTIHQISQKMDSFMRSTRADLAINKPRFFFPELARANFNIYGIGSPNKAIPFYRDAISLYAKNLLCGSLKRDQIWHGITNAYSRTSQHDLAIDCVKKYIVLDSPLEGKVGSLSWDILLQRDKLNKNYLYVPYRLAGETLLDKYVSTYSNKPDKASLLLAHRIFCTIDTMLEQSILTNSEEAIIRIIQNEGDLIYANAVKAAYLLHKHFPSEPKYLDWALVFMEKQKGYILRSKTRSNFHLAPEGYKSLVNELQSRYAATRDDDGPWTQKLLDSLNNTYPEYSFSSGKITNNTIKVVQNTIKSEEAVIEYFWGFNEVFVLLITKDTAVFDIAFNNAGLLDTTINEFRRFFVDTVVARDFKDLARKDSFANCASVLSKMLLGRIYPHLSKVNKLTIMCDKQIHNVNFDALFQVDQPVLVNMDYKSMPYIVNKFFVSYGQSYLNYKERKTKLPEPNMHIQVLTSEEFCHLYDNLEVYLPNADIGGYKSPITSTEQFFKYLGSCNRRDMLCIYAHGIGANSADSCRLLFGFDMNKNKNNGKGPEIMGDALRKIKLDGEIVVLLACEGAQGNAQNSEDIYTLMWYLQLAGGGTMVSSYSNIHPDISADLLNAFYKNLNTSKSVSEALTNAKRDLLKADEDEDEDYKAAPYFWASLSCFQ